MPPSARRLVDAGMLMPPLPPKTDDANKAKFYLMRTLALHLCMTRLADVPFLRGDKALVAFVSLQGDSDWEAAKRLAAYQQPDLKWEAVHSRCTAAAGAAASQQIVRLQYAAAAAGGAAAAAELGAAACEALARDGAVVIEGVISAATCAAVRQQMQPYIEASAAPSRLPDEGAFDCTASCTGSSPVDFTWSAQTARLGPVF